MFRAGARTLAAAAVAVALAAAACGRSNNPVLGDWELDRDATGSSAVLAVETTDLARITLRDDAIVAGDSVIPVTWAVEGARVRAIRADGRGEHVVEVLTGDRIRVALPIGVEAVYARAGS